METAREKMIEAIVAHMNLLKKEELRIIYLLVRLLARK